MPQTQYLRDWCSQARDGRSITTNGGALAAHVAECETCGAMPGERCTTLDPPIESGNHVHTARAQRAYEILAAPLRDRERV